MTKKSRLCSSVELLGLVSTTVEVAPSDYNKKRALPKKRVPHKGRKLILLLVIYINPKNSSATKKNGFSSGFSSRVPKTILRASSALSLEYVPCITALI